MKNRMGMTLIEVTVALALSALLLVTTAGVIKSMQERKKVFADQLSVQPWRRELAERLRDDLLRSREMRIGARSLELSGFCGHDPLTGEPTHNLVYVRWLLKREEDYDILLRIEMPRDGSEDVLVAQRVEPLAVGITNISVGTFSGRDNEANNEVYTVTSSRYANDERGHWATIPKALRLVVRGPNSMVLIDELIFR